MLEGKLALAPSPELTLSLPTPLKVGSWGQGCTCKERRKLSLPKADAVPRMMQKPESDTVLSACGMRCVALNETPALKREGREEAPGVGHQPSNLWARPACSPPALDHREGLTWAPHRVEGKRRAVALNPSNLLPCTEQDPQEPGRRRPLSWERHV